jgi:plasmid stabilization system protein ParE
MSGRYVLAPEAAFDLVEIWRYMKKQSSIEMADRVESVIRDKIVFLAGNHGAGHWRRNLDTVLICSSQAPSAASDVLRTHYSRYISYFIS